MNKHVLTNHIQKVILTVFLILNLLGPFLFEFFFSEKVFMGIGIPLVVSIIFSFCLGLLYWIYSIDFSNFLLKLLSSPNLNYQIKTKQSAQEKFNELMTLNYHRIFCEFLGDLGAVVGFMMWCSARIEIIRWGAYLYFLTFIPFSVIPRIITNFYSIINQQQRPGQNQNQDDLKPLTLIKEESR